MIPRHFLKQRQGLPLEAKVVFSQNKIREFYDHLQGNVYVSFSGGKDSTVLLDLVRNLYPDVPAVFADTGLEYPEIRKFIKTIDNVIWIKPKIPFTQVIQEYGYPVLSKRTAYKIRRIRKAKKDSLTYNYYMTGYDSKGNYSPMTKMPDKWKHLIDSDIKISDQCCDIMKKEPMERYVKESGRFPIMGTMASDGESRNADYLKRGCNVFQEQKSQGRPMSIWHDTDVWEYIKTRNLPYSKIYDTGVKRTGCCFCLFGVHLEKEPNRFQLMKQTHPKLYDYCINKLGCGKVLDLINVKH